MVAKHIELNGDERLSYLLAKIHMVAKHHGISSSNVCGYLLAKIHMVAKPQTDFIT